MQPEFQQLGHFDALADQQSPTVIGNILGQDHSRRQAGDRHLPNQGIRHNHTPQVFNQRQDVRVISSGALSHHCHDIGAWILNRQSVIIKNRLGNPGCDRNLVAADTVCRHAAAIKVFVPIRQCPGDILQMRNVPQQLDPLFCSRSIHFLFVRLQQIASPHFIDQGWRDHDFDNRRQHHCHLRLPGIFRHHILRQFPGERHQSRTLAEPGRVGQGQNFHQQSDRPFEGLV